MKSSKSQNQWGEKEEKKLASNSSYKPSTKHQQKETRKQQ
jgi:hypothetical protein